MYINRINLTNFRNYNTLDIEPCEGINIFYGQNAQGKTNIIESIYMASTGKSHRTQKDSELIKWDRDFARIKVDFNKEEDKKNIEISLSRNVKKQIKINGVKLSKTGELIGNLKTVIFSPDHMKIVKEGPVERRRFMDIILSQVKPGYYYDLVQYLKVLEQRNNLLNGARKDIGNLKTLDVWNEQLAGFGTRIIMRRASFVKKICSISAEIHERISNGKERLMLKYIPSVEYSIESENDIKRVFLKELEKYVDKDIRRGITHKGPHRDDIAFFINDKEVKNYSSQGQQRTTLLSLKISELKYMETETEELPILLLDDVFSELDNERQKYLVDYINNIQTFITCTDVEYVEKLRLYGSMVYKVMGGMAVKE